MKMLGIPDGEDITLDRLLAVADGLKADEKADTFAELRNAVAAAGHRLMGVTDLSGAAKALRAAVWVMQRLPTNGAATRINLVLGEEGQDQYTAPGEYAPEAPAEALVFLPDDESAGPRLAALMASAYSLRAVGDGLASNDPEVCRLLGFEALTPTDGMVVRGRPVPNELRSIAGGPPWYLIIGPTFGGELPETAWQLALAAYMCEPDQVRLAAPRLYDYFAGLFGREFIGEDSYAALWR